MQTVDEKFIEEEKKFRAIEKTVKTLWKNISTYLEEFQVIAIDFTVTQVATIGRFSLKELLGLNTTVITLSKVCLCCLSPGDYGMSQVIRTEYQ